MRIEELTYRYTDRQPVLKNVNLSLNKGEKVAVIGLNGTGKTTLLLLMARAVKPTKGKVRFDGRVAMVFQDPTDQFIEETVYDDIAYGLRLQKISEIEIGSRINKMAERLGIVALLSSSVMQLSYGEKKKVALAGALITEPTLLLLDEMMAYLDGKTTQVIKRVLDEAVIRGTTIVAVSHNMRFVAEWAERVLVLRDNQLTSYSVHQIGGRRLDKNSIEKLLLAIQEGEINIDQAVDKLKVMPFEDIGYAKVDYHRGLRNGFPEVIFCQGKSVEQIRGIVTNMIQRQVNVLGTRITKEVFEALGNIHDDLVFYEEANIMTLINKPAEKKAMHIAVVSGGTADIPVAEEAAITAELYGNHIDRIYDVGVAGIHRLLSQMERLKKADVVIAVAGMEGALPSVVGGLVDVPVIAVPTSVGYGANFGGVSALLTMINSCASGISVVNIDNGFGAGYQAATITHRMEERINDAIKHMDSEQEKVNSYGESSVL